MEKSLFPNIRPGIVSNSVHCSIQINLGSYTEGKTELFGLWLNIELYE